MQKSFDFARIKYISDSVAEAEKPAATAARGSISPPQGHPQKSEGHPPKNEKIGGSPSQNGPIFEGHPIACDSYSPEWKKAFCRDWPAIWAEISSEKFDSNAPSVKLLRQVDFQEWLRVESAKDEALKGDFKIPEGHPPGLVIEILHSVYKRLQNLYKNPSNGGRDLKSLELHFQNRAYWVLFWCWYTVLSLYVEHVEEYRHFSELIRCATDADSLQDAIYMAKLFAGWELDDRELFLNRLREDIAQRQQELLSKKGQRHG